MKNVPNEYIVEGFPRQDKVGTKEAGERMYVAGARNMRSANDFLTRINEPSVDAAHQIGFGPDADKEHYEVPSRTA